MKKKYRFKNKALEQALNVIYEEEYVEDQVDRQMTNTTSYICFELDHSSTTISKTEIAEVKEYNPNGWNPFPDVLPPEGGYYLIFLGRDREIPIKVDKYEINELSEYWKSFFRYQVLAFRALNVEPPAPEELNE